jgi:2-polyprenyl-3-methyl-5-hydroxy-6-metoxy-1,4-benzoquinol methylase
MSRFDELAATFAADQRGPWPELRYRLIAGQIGNHIEGRPLTVLDAGGGAGSFSVRMARDGHNVTLLDQSEGMLAQARDAAAEAGVTLRFLETTIEEADDFLPDTEFDVVAAHDVLAYVVNLNEALRSLRQWVKANGVLSLVVVNAVSLPLWSAMHDLNFEEALTTLGARTWRGRFSDSARAFQPDELADVVAAAGLEVVETYGLGVISPYIPDKDTKFAEERIDRLAELEATLGAASPYKEVARRLHIVARRAG